MCGGVANLGITLSSQPIAVTRAAQRHVAIMRETDPKLEDPTYVTTLYGKTAVPARTNRSKKFGPGR
jgi:hypothetical protein